MRRLIGMLVVWVLFTGWIYAERRDAVKVVIDRTKLTCTITIPSGFDDHYYVFPVLIGKLGVQDGVTCTPAGKFRVTYKAKNPKYKDITPGAEVIERYTQDKRNKYGTRIIGLSYRRPGATRGLSIHGTNEPELIPGFGSNMCIRLHNKNIEILYELLEVGDLVEIVN